MTQKQKHQTSLVILITVFAAMTIMGLLIFITWPNLSSSELGAILLLGFLPWISWVVMTVYVYRDASRRGSNGLLWALFVFFGHIFGFLVYLLVRNIALPGANTSLAICPSCQKPVQPDFAVCPYCRTDLHMVCPSCNRVLQRDWQICPYCRHELMSSRAVAKQVSEIVQTPLGNLPAVS